MINFVGITKMEVWVHKPPMKTILYCILACDNLQDAVEILNAGFEEMEYSITDILKHRIYEFPKQLNLFV